MNKEETMHNLAKLQSRNSSERTLLAWIRTSLTLIGFGFGIPGILNVLQTEHIKNLPSAMRNIKILGSSFIVLGLVSIIVALIQYRLQIKQIMHPNYKYKESFHLSFIVSILLFSIGLFAFIATL
jgi:putative membrane protein